MADSKTVREFSTVGPCLKLGLLLRETVHFYVFAPWRGGSTYEVAEKLIRKRQPDHYSPAHVEPCPSCPDHEKTQYPNGYMD